MVLLGNEEEAVSDGHGAAVATLPEREEARAHAEWPFQVGLVYLRDLRVDDRYQRPVQERFVAGMADDWDDTLVGAISVSARIDGTYAILDGQQRYAAMLRVGKTTCYAAIFAGMELEDEAGFFYRVNKDRKAMAGWYGFRARMVAGDIEAIAINDIVAEHSFMLGENTDNVDTIGAIRAVERAWGFSSEHRNECLSPALQLIREAYYGREGSLDAMTISSFARFWQAFPDTLVDRAALRGALEDIGSPKNLAGLGKERLAQMPKGTTQPSAMADALVVAYNRRKRGDNRAPNFEGKLDASVLHSRRVLRNA